MIGRELNEECGVAGIIGDPLAANLLYLGLYALQHRGQEACGIVTFNGSQQDVHIHKSFGLVVDGVTKEVLAKLPGDLGIGHVRYSTQGGKLFQNIQPFYFNSMLGPLAVAHNGNLTNSKELRDELEGNGSIFQSTSDTEIFMHLIARSKSKELHERIAEVMAKVRGAYSLVLICGGKLFAVRDPFGFRPLVLGKRGSAWVAVSETCALDLIEAEFVREVAPGEIVELKNDEAPRSFFPVAKPKQTAHCSFEPIYFARPDSRIFGAEVYEVRKQIGKFLAQETAVDADVVIAIPDSGVPMALGYAEESGLPHQIGLVRNHYVGRTFIEPAQEIRDFGVKLKLNPVNSVLAGKRVVVVDDSIVRGTTSVKILRMLRKAGAKEIHFRIGAPPITHSCYFGVDTPQRSQLLAAQKNVQQMREFIGADSLGFLSLKGLEKALHASNAKGFCFGCFNGNYPDDVFTKILPQPTDALGPGLLA